MSCRVWATWFGAVIGNAVIACITGDWDAAVERSFFQAVIPLCVLLSEMVVPGETR